ncbi:aspartate--ammonia ligase [Neocallimastix lanati (nom. inval.)]|jgi:aspartate--ammonia ligase|uniref:Aspartate--ammonia ligase n=1 Tax=Neocallimastix californiae TaxID=1754190 RepID=A0A1Y2EN38_9FUNG|nr:aspartate--ammonia ligase [Neocallimastix sp. JGI-2020a]ORY72981.1 aspartate--ammonia ligase [Neocallimastix californiae]|eukprot:ORY72981.1 aspartate--ammonia ligase [Neocallimastix californiae]
MLIIPENYKPTIVPEMSEDALKLIKDKFEDDFSSALRLRRVTAPLFVAADTGINDNLNGIERPVSFGIKCMNDKKCEIVHSLAKWKRMKLGAYNIMPGYGLYTDMNALRPDEEDLDNLHSVYVDQWDWERSIRASDRNLKYLKKTVKTIYTVLKDMEEFVYKRFPHITPVLPDSITFIQSEDLLKEYPDLSPFERENKVAEKYGAVFIIGIGGKLSNGVKHDGRAPDYDDWSTPTENGYFGLNGDIIFWNPILKRSFEISSMGIRVDKEALIHQLKETDTMDRAELPFHKAVLEDKIPLSIGGGIGQSRLCMFLLRMAHIGESQSSIWPEDMVQKCTENGIILK